MTAVILPFRPPPRVPARVSMRARLDRVNDGWSDRLVPAGESFACSPRRAAELLSIHAADLVRSTRMTLRPSRRSRAGPSSHDAQVVVGDWD